MKAGADPHVAHQSSRCLPGVCCNSEDEAYAKAYFRRAVVSACLGEYEAAQDDLAVCAELEPSTAEECERELRRMQQQQAAAEAKQRDTLKGFFNR